MGLSVANVSSFMQQFWRAPNPPARGRKGESGRLLDDASSRAPGHHTRPGSFGYLSAEMTTANPVPCTLVNPLSIYPLLHTYEPPPYLRELGPQLRHHPLDEKVSKLHTLQTLLRRRYGIEHCASGLVCEEGSDGTTEAVGTEASLVNSLVGMLETGAPCG